MTSTNRHVRPRMRGGVGRGRLKAVPYPIGRYFPHSLLSQVSWSFATLRIQDTSDKACGKCLQLRRGRQTVSQDDQLPVSEV
jgi:hypothetical protein